MNGFYRDDHILAPFLPIICRHVESISANERRRYICVVFSHWLRAFTCDFRSYLDMYRKWTLFQLKPCKLRLRRKSNHLKTSRIKYIHSMHCMEWIFLIWLFANISVFHWLNPVHVAMLQVSGSPRRPGGPHWSHREYGTGLQDSWTNCRSSSDPLTIGSETKIVFCVSTLIFNNGSSASESKELMFEHNMCKAYSISELMFLLYVSAYLNKIADVLLVSISHLHRCSIMLIICFEYTSGCRYNAVQQSMMQHYNNRDGT